MRTLLAVLVTLTLATSLNAQSLAGAAKAAALTSSALAQPAKVYTNKDLKQMPGPVVISAPSDEVREADDPKKDEAYWKRRMRPLQAQLSNDAMVMPTISKLMGIYTIHHPYPETTETRSPVKDLSVPYIDGMPYVSRWFQSKTYDTNDQLSRGTAAVQRGKEAIAALEEEARRAGVPPGWLRP
jgi:hypothetical protein